MTEKQTDPQVTIISTENCRRNQMVLEYLIEHGIAHHHVSLNSIQGQKLWEKHLFRVSLGILVNGISVNPYDILDQKHCRVDENKAMVVFIKGQS